MGLQKKPDHIHGKEMKPMAIIPLNVNCFWCIVPIGEQIEIYRNHSLVSFEYGNWSKMNVEEKYAVCNKLIEDARKECSDVPDVSKRPISFEL